MGDNAVAGQAPNAITQDPGTEPAASLFLLNNDTWVTKETLSWLEKTQVPTFVVNDSLEIPQVNTISETDALGMLLSEQAAGKLKVMTNGEAAYGWLTEQLPEDHFLVRQLNVCSRKSLFRQVSQHAFPGYMKTFSAKLNGRDSDASALEGLVDQMGTTTEERRNFIVKPSRGFCAVGVDRFSVATREAGPGPGGDAEALHRFASRQYGLRQTFLVESYLNGPQYTCDGYFDSHGEPHIVSVSLAPKFDGRDIREIVLGTNAALLEEQLPLAKTMMARLQSSATELHPEAGGPFFRNFCFMVEYRVPETEKVALPIEVNSLRHEGKSPTYARLFHGRDLYDYFFEDLGDCDAQAMRAHMKAKGAADADTVAAMVFARKPADVFPADKMDFPMWAGHLRSMSVTPDQDLPHEERFAHSDGNFFFGVAMGYFARWSVLDELLVPNFEEQFQMERGPPSKGPVPSAMSESGESDSVE